MIICFVDIKIIIRYGFDVEISCSCSGVEKYEQTRPSYCAPLQVRCTKRKPNSVEQSHF